MTVKTAFAVAKVHYFHRNIYSGELIALHLPTCVK